MQDKQILVFLCQLVYKIQRELLKALKYSLIQQQKMKKRVNASSKFMNKYVNKRKLGKGAFGDVFLVQDPDEQLFALKVIDRQKLTGENEDMIEYLRDEIKCMKEMNHRNLVKLIQVLQDDDYYYMVLEYCDGGDLTNEQVTFPNKVFSLQSAVSNLSQVIIGLEQLHKCGYLHRDIKLQNVLIKTQNGQKVLKIADFGFAKKAKNLHGTVLGTEQYMSPEIYQCGLQDAQVQLFYGFEVDMWAFGVLFYYMLNMDFPFQLNPYWSLEEKYNELAKKAASFSYKEAVMKTRKKIAENCTPEIEDLFRKIFTTDTGKRITFSEIRQHPVFAKHFPKPSKQSAILYRNKFESMRLKKKNSTASEIQNRLVDKAKKMRKEGLGISSIIADIEDNEFPREKEILRLQLSEIDFLWQMVQQLNLVEKQIGSTKSLMFAYNLTKYYIILLKSHLGQLTASNYCSKYRDRKLEWNAYFNLPEFTIYKKNTASLLAKAEIKFLQLYSKCQYQFNELVAANEYFQSPFSSTVRSQDYCSQSFLKSYRKTTAILYSTLIEYLKTNKILKFYFYLCGVCICHVFNDFYVDPKLKESIFGSYLAQEKEQTQIFSYERFLHYLKTSSKETLLKQARKIIDECMN